MQTAVEWWCHLIGITDAQSVSVATGVVGGGFALYAMFIVYVLVVAMLGGRKT